MEADLSIIDQEYFVVRPCRVGGESCFLVFPKSIGAKWNRQTLIFRSSVWTKSGKLVSASFKKFFNWGEQPELAHVPASLKNATIMEKIDGSTLIVSKYQGELIVRTRGTITAEGMDNGYEIATLKQKYPRVFDGAVFDSVVGTFKHAAPTWNFSLIFEWVSPVNKIVLKYDEPDIYLTGVVNHDDYSLMSQEGLDQFAGVLQVKRPRTFKFDTFENMFGAIHALDYEASRKFASPQEVLVDSRNKASSDLAQNFEGFCVYCNRGQDIRKVKSAWYLALHKLKSELASPEKVIDLWMTLNRPSYLDYYNHVKDTIDFEVAESCKADMSRICGANHEIESMVAHMRKFAENLKSLAVTHGFQKGRKLQAEAIFKAYGDTNRAGYVFSLLDGKELTRDQIKKLLYQVIKK